MNGTRKYLIWEIIAGIFVVFAAVCIIVAYNVSISLHVHDYGIEGDNAFREKNYFRAKEYLMQAENIDSDKVTNCNYQMMLEYCNTRQLDKAKELLYRLDDKQKDVFGDKIFRMYLENNQLYDNMEDLFRTVSEQESEKMRRKLEEAKYEKAVKAYKEGFYSDAEKLFGQVEDDYKEKNSYLKKISKMQNKISEIVDVQLISMAGSQVQNERLFFVTSKEDALKIIKDEEEDHYYKLHLFTVLSKSKEKMKIKSVLDGKKQTAIVVEDDGYYEIWCNDRRYFINTSEEWRVRPIMNSLETLY